MNDSGTGRHLRGIHVRDGLAYLAYWRHGLIILDVGNGLRNGSAEKPELVSNYAYSVADWYPPDMSAGAHAVLRHGNHLFLADEVRPGGADWASRERVPGLGMVHVFDITDPAAPVRVAEYRLPERGALGLAAEGDVLYVAFGEGGLRALDIGGELRGDLDAQGREIGAVWTGNPAGYRPNVPMARSVTVVNGLAVVSDQKVVRNLRKHSAGTCGLARRPTARFGRDATIRHNGAGGGTLARERWGTWLVTLWTCRSGPLSCDIQSAVRRKVRKYIPKRVR